VGSARLVALLASLVSSSACFVDAVGSGNDGLGGGGAGATAETIGSTSASTGTTVTTSVTTGAGGAGGGSGGGGEGGSCDGFLSFDGGHIASVASDPAFGGSDAFAFGARVRLRDDVKFTLTVGAASQIVRNADSGLQAGYALGVGESEQNDGLLHPIAGVWLATGLCSFLPGEVAPVVPDVWTRLDIVYERNHPAGQDLRFFRNGVQEAQLDCPDAAFVGLTKELELGGSIEFVTRYLRGDIDDVFVKAGAGFAPVPHPVACDAGFAIALSLDDGLASSCPVPLLEVVLGTDGANPDIADPILGCR
jgi:hypothetical protein